MLTKIFLPLLATTLASAAFGNTPKTPQSPVPNIEATPATPVTRDASVETANGATASTQISAPAELTIPETNSTPALTIEKSLPDQTVSEQLAAKKAAAQKAAAQKIQTQRAAAQRAAAKKEAARKAQAQEQATKPVTPTLGAVSTEVEGDLTIITARLNKSPDWKEVAVEEHGTFLQIKLPGTIIPASGEFIDGNGPFLKKIATFQVSDSDGAIRLFVNQDAAKAKLATSADVLGDRIVMTIDHKKLEQLIAPAQKPKVETAAQTDTTANAHASSDQNPSPADLIAMAGTASNESKAKATPVQHLYNRLTKVAAFCAVLFLAFLSIQLFRSKKTKKNTSMLSGHEIEPATLKILSSINLGQKQRLSLVQVGSQQVLLGVSPDAITMLTTIESRQKANFATQLQMANPNAEIRLKAPDDVPPARPQRRTLATNSNTIAAKSNNGSSPGINIAIDDEGPRMATPKSSKKEDDITRMLRDRLRNLPPG